MAWAVPVGRFGAGAEGEASDSAITVPTLCTYKSIDLYVVTEIMESQPKPMAGCGTLVPDKLWN